MKKLLFLFSLCICMQLTGNEIDTWSSPTTISTTGINSSNPNVGMDTAGNVVAIWLEAGTLVAKTKLLSGSWSSATTLSSSTASTPGLVVNPSTGDATAIWVESGVVKSSTLPFGSSWGAATTLSGTTSSSPQIAINSSTGDSVAVWVTSGVVESATKLSGMSWSASPDTLSSSNSSFPQVAIGSDGVVVAVWETLNGVTTLFNVVSANKTISGTWSTASTISDTSKNSVFPQVAVGSSGQAAAVWYTYDLSSSIYSNVFLQFSNSPTLSSWSTPINLSAAGIINPANLVSQILFNNSGEVIAIWTQGFDGSNFSIQSVLSNDLVHFDTPITLDLSLYSYAINAATNSIGDVFGAYMAANSSDVVINTVESRIGSINGNFWTNPVLISTVNNNGFPQIKSVITGGTNANGIAAWIAFDGSNNVIQASTGTGTIVEPASNLTISQSSTNFNVFQEFSNTLSWTASQDPNLVAYGIYRNGSIIAVIDSTQITYVDHNQVQNGSITYGVSAFDSAGSESSIITATFP